MSAPARRRVRDGAAAGAQPCPRSRRGGPGPAPEDAAVVEYEHITGAEIVRQIVETAVGDAAVQPGEHHETRVVPGLDRGLGDQTLRQVVVEVAGLQSAEGGIVRVPGGTARRRSKAAAHPFTAKRAAVRVLCRSMAMVIGPTPPGTGVMAAAFSDTASKSTSPTRR